MERLHDRSPAAPPARCRDGRRRPRRRHRRRRRPRPGRAIWKQAVELGDARAVQAAGPAPWRGRPAPAWYVSRIRPRRGRLAATARSIVWAMRARRMCRGWPPSASGVNSSGSCRKCGEKLRERFAAPCAASPPQAPFQADHQRLPRRPLARTGWRRAASPSALSVPWRAPTARAVSRQVAMMTCSSRSFNDRRRSYSTTDS